MTVFNANQHPRGQAENAGQFREKPNSEPERALQQPGESLVWAVEGDDHEVELMEATTPDEALELAGDAFRNRYDDEGYSDDLLSVVGAFRGNIDETDELEFVPTDGTTEMEARRILGMYQ